MDKSGYTVLNVLVREVEPPESVLSAMNDINASERRLRVAKNEGEAFKIQKVLEAEAEAARKELQGIGVSKMREAIMSGWTTSISDMSKQLGIPPEKVTEFILDILRIDTMGEIGRAPNSKTLFVNTDPIIRNSIMQAHESQDAKEPAASIKGISI